MKNKDLTEIIKTGLAVFGAVSGAVLIKRLIKDKQIFKNKKLTNSEKTFFDKNDNYIGGFILGESVNDSSKILKLSKKQRFTNVLIEGGSSSNKSSAFIIPQLIEDALNKNVNAFVIDKKSPELYLLISDVWKRQGHKVILFDPWSTKTTVSFEPLWNADDDNMLSIANVFIQPSLNPDSPLVMYQQLNRKILISLFKCFQELGKNDRSKCNLPAVAQTVSRGWKASKQLIEDVRPQDIVSMPDIWNMQESRLSELWMSLTARLSVFLNPITASSFIKSDFEMTDVVAGCDTTKDTPRTLLLIGNNQNHKEQGNVVISLMTQMLINEVFTRGREMTSKMYSNMDVIPVSVVLDEADTYPVPSFQGFIATCRSLGACVTAFVKDSKWWLPFYRKDDLKGILACFSTKIYLSEKKSLYLINNKLIDKDYLVDDEKIDLTDHVAIKIKPDQAFIDSPLSLPLLINLHYYFNDKKLNSLIEESDDLSEDYKNLADNLNKSK